jgi:hypothetical protein
LDVNCPPSKSGRSQHRVGIVSGNRLGLSLTSLATLGQNANLATPSAGRNAERAYVNVANGNLVLVNQVPLQRLPSDVL